MQIFILLLLTVVSVVVSFISMMFGWGLEVQSWGWLIFSYIFAFVAGVAIQIVGNS